jgi:hypothetical protein
MGMTEFFAMEAGEYLERLDALVSGAGAPEPEELVRLTRALRGSALMANQQVIAGVAAGLEAMARGLRESRIPWDAGTRQLAIRAIDDLQVLIRSLGSWTSREEDKARAITEEMERRAGVRPVARPSGPRRPDTGTRAFVAREGAAVASELNRLAGALLQNPATAPAAAVLTAMQPLRGVAGLADLPPIPDILAGVERAAGMLDQGVPPAQASAVFGAAARALARAAQEAAAGSPTGDSPELADFATRLTGLFDPDGGPVPIESLFYDDAGPHVVQPGTAPPRAGTIGRVELVAHGDHLRQAADDLEHAASPAQRELRAQSLTPTLGALAAAGGAIGAVAAAARDALARTGTLADLAPLSTTLRDAGRLLSHASGPDDPGLTDPLTRIAATLRTLGRPVAAVPPRQAAAPSPPRPEAAASPSGPSAPAPETSVPPPAPGLPESDDLTGSLLRFNRYAAALGFGTPSLSDLLAGPPVLEANDGAPAGENPVPISDLCYSGPAALERALSLRDELRAAMKAGGGRPATELLEEIFDLVQLGLGSKR